MKILKRAKEITQRGAAVFATSPMKLFLSENIDADRMKNPEVLNMFSQLDDMDVFVCIKEWINSDDKVLSELSKMLVNRKLLKVKQKQEPFSEQEINEFKDRYSNPYNFSNQELDYFIFQDAMSNHAYDSQKDEIKIVFKNGDIKDITEASDNFNIQSLANPVKKYFLFHPEFSA